jgi:hypothetical protein
MWGRAGEGVDRSWRYMEKEFVRACEAFLGGRFAQYLDDRGRPAPEWAWVNVLAHRSADDLADLAAGRASHRFITGNTRTWEDALAFLAEEVLDAASFTQLETLQRDVLVPLELELTTVRLRLSLGPRHLARVVTDALDDYRAAQRRAHHLPRHNADGAEA